jgi:undecaprenyl-diphosphatase
MSPPSFVDQFFIAVTWLGSLVVLLPCTAILVFFFCRSNRKHEALLLGAGLGLSSLMTYALKPMFKRPRPAIENLLVPMPTDWSFPSGHTAQATAFFLALAFLATRCLPQPAAGLTVATSVIAALIVAYSRVYLQVHYVSDVLAGAFVGGLAVLVVATAIKQR